jgi:pyruvate, water dikinase
VTPAGAHVLDLGDLRGTDTPRVGPKAARLAQLAADGWRVPDGYVVTVGALGTWLPEEARSELARLFTGLSADPAAVAHHSERARALVESQPIPPWLADAVGAAHERLRARTGLGPGLKVAVRSSAVIEDGASASFAGQFGTYLGITEPADVLHHIRKCQASGYTAWAVEYRRRNGLPLPDFDLAVAVMQLVDVRSAGVVFTLDPVTGDRGRMIVEANWGFGESVVSGQVTPDQWAVDRASGQIVDRRVGTKHVWSAFEPAAGQGAGVTLQPLPADLAQAPSLDDDEVRYLCLKAAEIEASEGVPQDVEWAIARDTPLPDSVFILQHRPETTWPAAAAKSEPAAAPAFDPVRYALRNVFKVPGT